MNPRLESLLLGKSSNLSLRYLEYAVVFMALFFGQRYLAGNFEIGNASGLFMSPLGAGVVAAILTGVHTYRNDGILVSVAVAVIVVSGSTLYAVTALAHPQPDYGLVTGVGTAMLYGVPIGILSATVAYALRRFAPSRSPVMSE
jgi:hypothetical protein